MLSLWFRRALAVAGLVFLAPLALSAQAPTPIVTVATSPLGELVDDFEYLARLGVAFDDEQKAKTDETFKKVRESLEGLDLQQPLGGFVELSDDGTPRAMGFIPVKNLDQVLKTIGDQLNVQPEDVGGGVQKLGGVHFVQQNGYVFLAADAKSLGTLPDPAKVLGDMSQKYDIGVVVNPGKIPVFLKQIGLGFIRQGLDDGLDEAEEGEDDAAKEAQRELVEAQYESVERFVLDTDRVMIGWRCDRTAKMMQFDFDFSAKPGSPMALQFASSKPIESRFGGLVGNETIGHMQVAYQLGDGFSKEMNLKQLGAFEKLIPKIVAESEEELDTEEQRQILQEILEEGLNLVQNLVIEGKQEQCLALEPNGDGDWRFILAVGTGEAKRFEALAKKAAGLAEEVVEDFPEPKFDVEKHNGYQLHYVTLPEPKDEEAEEVVEYIFGAEQVAVGVGVGEDVIVVSVGGDAIADLKNIIDRIGRPAKMAHPTEATIRGLPILDRVLGSMKAAEETVPEEWALVRPLLEGGKDRFHMHADFGERNIDGHVTLDETLLKIWVNSVTIAGRSTRRMFEQIEKDLDQ